MANIVRKVLDSNYATKPELEEYLSRSESNRVVITDFFGIEANKGDNLDGVHRSYEILGRFPHQIDVLKPTGKIMKLKARQRGMQSRFIDSKQSSTFNDYFEALVKAREGNQSYIDALEDQRLKARALVDRFLAETESFRQAVDEFSESYNSSELKQLRSHKELSLQTARKMVNHVVIMTRVYFDQSGGDAKSLHFHNVPGLYLFRLALCQRIQIQTWISYGGAKDAGNDRLLNDLVDYHQAAYATVFDGFLSGDRKAQKIYGNAKDIIDLIDRKRASSLDKKI